MKKLIELVKYQLHIYFKGSKFVMPFVVMIIILRFMYSTSNNNVVSSFISNCYVVFLIMVWMSLSASSAESPIMEQMILLQVKSNVYYYLSKMLFFIILSVITSGISLVIPIIINLLNQGSLFQRALTSSDFINGFIILCGSSIAGSSLGSFFHSRVIKDRKIAKVLAALFTMAAIARTAVINELPFMKIITWMFPPLDSVSKAYVDANFFQVGSSIKLIFLLFVYAILLFIVKSVICYKRKF